MSSSRRRGPMISEAATLGGRGKACSYETSIWSWGELVGNDCSWGIFLETEDTIVCIRGSTGGVVYDEFNGYCTMN